CGRLSAGSRLPSTRALANSLGVSRTTVTECYDDLISEGYLHAKNGSGTFVCDYLPEQLLKTTPPAMKNTAPKTIRSAVRLSTYGERVREIIAPVEVDEEKPIDFTHWRPAFDHLPLRLWRRLIARHIHVREPKNFDYSEDTLGYEPLREAIARYVSGSRAVKCAPAQVFISAGA